MIVVLFVWFRKAQELEVTSCMPSFTENFSGSVITDKGEKLNLEKNTDSFSSCRNW